MNRVPPSVHRNPCSGWDQRGCEPLHTEVPIMSVYSRQPSARTANRGAFHAVVASVGGFILLIGLVTMPGLPAQAEQTRDQCRKCCEGKGLDEYYLEQCKLKCFRSPDHCLDTKAAPKPEAKEPPQPAPAERPRAAEPPRPAVRQPAPPTVQEAPPPRREPAPAPRGAPFTWPSPLNLTPGREWEAAGQILTANGMTPQHPNFQRALRAVEAVLIDFARSNPQGGQLPTAALEQILRQNR